jgi:FkbM family methyltransferase
VTLFYPSHSLVGKFVASGQGWDTVLLPVLRTLITVDRALIVEVGSNFGASLVQMKRALPDARFVCFEPSEHFRRVLQKNVRVNRWRDVRIEPLLVARSAGTLLLHRSSSTASVVAAEYDGHAPVESETVEATTLDGYFATTGPIAFLKTDTDGYEFQVLLGARQMLARDRPVMFVEFHPALLRRAGDEPLALLGYLNDLGYRDALVLSNYGEALEVTDQADRILEIAAEHDYVDLVCVHDSRSDGNALLQGLCGSLGTSHSLRNA